MAGLVLVTLAALGTGCSATLPSVEQETAVSRKCRVVVVPFIDMSAIFGNDASVRGPATHQVFVTGTVDAGARERLDGVLRQELSRRQVLNWSAAALDPNALPAEAIIQHDTHIKALCDIGVAGGGEVVLAGYLYTFEDRRGSDYGVESPASIAIELVMIQVNTGQLIWRKRYDEQQQPLSNNLMAIGRFLKRKGRWVSALEMARQAIDEMMPELMNALPY